MKVLVTGGAGFIGSAVVRHLIQNTNAEVLNLDCLTYAGNLLNLAEVSGASRYKFEQVDICHRKEVDRVLADFRPSHIIHLAAESHVDRSIDGALDFLKTNIIGTYTLLEASRKYLETAAPEILKNFKFLHVSTDEVFGDLPHPDDDPDALNHLFQEDSAYAPSSPYSASKASSDHLVRAWHRTYGLPIVISNCSNNYGPFHFPEKLIPLTILNALAGKTLPVYGTGDQIRDWLYVEDHARALCMILCKGQIGQSYNIGGNNEEKNINVVHLICDLLQELRPPDRSSKIEHYRNLIEFVHDRPGHDRRYAIDATKIETEIGWRPEETFETGMLKTVSWYLANAEWCGAAVKGSGSNKRLGTIQKLGRKS